MTVQENLDLVRRGYAAFSAGDAEGLMAVFAPDIAHIVPGSGPISGAHKGVEAVLALYGQLAERSNGTMRVDLETVTSDGGDRVVAIHTATAERNGATITQRDALLFTISDGKVVEIQDFMEDIDANDAFWS
jgi:ketosteroid isomerase-like protein